MSEQQGHPLEPEPPTEEQKRLVAIFAEMESKELDFLDAAAKSLIERTATLLAILFAVTAFGSNFPPAYLKIHVLNKYLVLSVLVCYLVTMGMGLWAIQPHKYNLYRHNVSRMGAELARMTTRKKRWVRLAGIFFAIGTLALAGLIFSIVITV